MAPREAGASYAGEWVVVKRGPGTVWVSLVGQGNGDITPEVGVIGTPVIDPATNTLYVVSKSMNAAATTFYQRLHAIDLTTGNEKPGSPVTIAATFPGNGGTITFDPRLQNQRASLAFVNNTVYIAWASHEDNGHYYGWIVAYTYGSGSGFTRSSVLNVTPNETDDGGGIWMGGGAPAADSNGHLYLSTGNGTFDADTSTAPNKDYGDSFLQLTGTLGILTYFAPSDEASDDSGDQDFGAGGPALVLNLPSGPLQHVVVGGTKGGDLYLVNGDHMGGKGDANALQKLTLGSEIFSTGAFWNDTLYVNASGQTLAAYSFNTSTDLLSTTPSSSSAVAFGRPGTTPSVSASGSSTDGIVWALDNANYCTPGSGGCGPAVLHAYDATHLGTELWNSSMVAADAAGNAVKFTVPTIANGKVYVGTRGNNAGAAYTSGCVCGQLNVYGLKPN